MQDISRRSILALTAVAMSAAGARAQTTASDLTTQVQAKLQAMLAESRAPGCGVSVVHEGAVVMTQGLGLASVPFAAPATERTLFHMGSLSKQITASLVFELADSGAIDLNDPVGAHAKGLPQAFARVPIRTLLGHTSGVPDYEGLEGFEADRSIEREDFLTAASALPINFQPDEAWAYSNTGYVLLGYLLSDVTGRSYRELVAERLLTPIGLAETRVDDARAIIPGRAEPYVQEGDEVLHAVGMDRGYSGWPDGGVLMSARDAAAWERALQHGPTPGRSVLERLTTPMRLSTGRSTAYGAGWFTDQIGGRPVQTHSGSVPGFTCISWRAPATRTAVTVLVNSESGRVARFMREACLMLAETVAPGSTPLSLAPIADDAPEVTAEALAMITRGDRPLDAARFAPEIATLIGGAAAPYVVPPNAGSDISGITWTLVETAGEPGGSVRRYRLERNGRVRHFSFAYAPDGRVYRVRTV
ncbi:MAG: beta-lactamase family protein [Alphaproteobacteria bacterium]|nr:beta-lactamase family protein [Alphaproteobacteria bacterium]